MSAPSSLADGDDEELQQLRPDSDEDSGLTPRQEQQVITAAASLAASVGDLSSSSHAVADRRDTALDDSGGEEGNSDSPPAQSPHPITHPQLALTTARKKSSPGRRGHRDWSATEGEASRRAPAIMVPPPSKKRLEKEQELRQQQREAVVKTEEDPVEDTDESGIGTFRSLLDEELEKADSPDKTAVQEHEADESKEKKGRRVAVHFKSFVSEITTIEEESVTSEKGGTTPSDLIHKMTQPATSPRDAAERKTSGKTKVGGHGTRRIS